MIGRILHLSLLFGILSSMVSCLSVGEAKPDDYLNRAKESIQKQHYQLAKLYVDSVQICFPKNYSKIREAIGVMREINFAEQTRTLAFCDSMLKVKQTQLPDIQKKFKFEKNEDYETLGHYVHRSQADNKSMGKTYLQIKVDERGNLILTSYYCGKSAINHSRVRAEANDGTFAETQNIPYDGALNYGFMDGGLKYEMVCFNRKAENNLINYILINESKSINILLIGKQTFKYVLGVNDKLVAKDASNLSAVLTDINRLLNEIRLAQAKLEYIRLKQNGIETGSEISN